MDVRGGAEGGFEGPLLVLFPFGIAQVVHQISDLELTPAFGNGTGDGKDVLVQGLDTDVLCQAPVVKGAVAVVEFEIKFVSLQLAQAHGTLGTRLGRSSGSGGGGGGRVLFEEDFEGLVHVPLELLEGFDDLGSGTCFSQQADRKRDDGLLLLVFRIHVCCCTCQCLLSLKSTRISRRSRSGRRSLVVVVVVVVVVFWIHDGKLDVEIERVHQRCLRVEGRTEGLGLDKGSL